MSQLIDSTYEIIKQIGAGGGGVVYLANHTRLGKKVVLKADKRKITTRLTSLRREVDVLKELRHPYIPQVYDFFVYEDTAYTVIDYVEGESLNQPLKRGERFSQPQVIHWAIQLLEALCYLHSPEHGDPPRGFVHGDIKPANIMLTSKGDICLIDFNIALALGEEKAIGYSPGYASPEHYGQDLSSVSVRSSDSDSQTSKKRTAFRRKGSGTDDSRDVSESGARGTAGNGSQKVETGSRSAGEKSQRSAENSSGSSAGAVSGTAGKRRILPDTRSDIYSLGATLYHLLSGVRPAKDAMEVIPLLPRDFSPQIAAIINKAMNPNPNLRYQTAEEMLNAFLYLRDRDPRVIRRRRRNICAYSVFLCLFGLGAAASFVGLKRMQVTEQWLKLAEYSGNALQEGDTAEAVDYALQALPEGKSFPQPSVAPEVQKALTDAVGVYDLSDGYKTYETMELPSQLFFMELSPDGKTAACIYAYSMMIFDTESCRVLAALPVEDSALAEVEYLDNDTVIYAGEGGLRAYSISAAEELWVGNPATAIGLSADRKRAAAVYKDETFATVYDTANGNVITTVDFQGRHQWIAPNDIYANPQNNMLALNDEGSLMAESFSDGSLAVYDLKTGEECLTLLDSSSGYTHFEGGFYQKYLAFSAVGAEESLFVVADTDQMKETGRLQNPGSYYAAEVNDTGIYLQENNVLVNLSVSGENRPMVTWPEEIQRYDTDGAHTLITTKDAFLFFDENAELMERYENGYGGDFVRIAGEMALVGSMDSSVIRILKYENHPESQLFSYDPSCEHAEARKSSDGSTIMLFDYRHFQLYSVGGELIAEVSFPDSRDMYDQQYIRDEDGSRLEIYYNDGRITAYSAADGTLLYEKTGDKPDMTLEEEFLTDKYRIVSRLHEAPEVYDRKSGKLVCRLKEEDSLTYVTQIDGGIVVQYVTADGYCYGQLLDEKCKIIAELPYLCDVPDGNLIFDYPDGNLRQSRVYRIDEIIEIAKSQRGVMEHA